jgi:periplasmic divalent cation tolerance protein
VSGCALITTALGSEASATELADTLIGERLAACVQVIGPIRSSYHWEGAVQNTQEWLCVAKTAEQRQAALIDRIRALHTYQLPEIVSIPIAGGDVRYLAWIRRETAT